MVKKVCSPNLVVLQKQTKETKLKLPFVSFVIFLSKFVLINFHLCFICAHLWLKSANFNPRLGLVAENLWQDVRFFQAAVEHL